MLLTNAGHGVLEQLRLAQRLERRFLPEEERLLISVLKLSNFVNAV
jgi:hypothetical protein